jgi:DNA (cytosine-5)-methyltransferase 1
MPRKAAKNQPRDHGSSPTVVDLFCGAGGLSAGFASCGYDVIGGIDNWEPAVDSFKANEPRAHAVCGDARTLDAEDFKRSLRRRVDVVLGGPSCQGFSTSSGLSRNGRKENDPRNSLFMDFVRFVRSLQPSWVVMENVPGLLLYGRGTVGRQIIEEFRSIGYSVIPMILLAADFGVPQLRRRVVFVGNRTDQSISFPEPRFGDPDLWKDFALPFAHLSRLGNKNATLGVAPHRSIADACSDLPSLRAGESITGVPYPVPAASDYQRLMRRHSRVLTMHTAASLSPSDAECIPLIEAGGNWRSLPDDIRQRRFSRIRDYDATTMLKRPLWNKPSYTITTKSNDATAGAFIHPLADRTFSLREVARLQSFPDRYRFLGSDSQIREQIGNAVPPLLAEQIARAIAPEVLEAGGYSASLIKTVSRVEFQASHDVDELLGVGVNVAQSDRLQMKLFDATPAGNPAK